MTYLTNIPESAKDFGINKLLITRSLTLDFKHRGTQMFIREKSIIPSEIPLLDLLERRENQLRYIHHISRKALYKTLIKDLENTNIFKNVHLLSDFSTVYYDFLSLAKDGASTYNKLRKDNTIVFTTKHSEQAVLNHFIKHNLHAPSKIIFVTDEDIYDFNKDKLASIVLSDIIAKELNLKTLWCLNAHLFQTNKQGIHYVSFKTDETLLKGKPNEKISNNKKNH